MTPFEIGVVAALVLLLASQLVQVYVLARISQISTEMIGERVHDLNVALAEAVQNFVDNGAITAPNPLLGILARVFEQNIQNQNQVQVIPPKDEKGQFTSDNL